MEDFRYIEENLRAVRENLRAASERVGRPVPTLVAVTKSASDEEVRALLGFGVDAIAENRPQLFTARYEIAKEVAPETAVHLIGTLQTNKVKYVVGKAALIQSLDSEKLALEIEKQAKKSDGIVPVLIEINSGREEAKGGVLPEDVLSFAACVDVLPHLSLVGVMTMGPDCKTPEEYRPYFRLARELLDRLKEGGFIKTDAPILSMGMSGSYTVAAEEGATMVRVGRTLFRKSGD